MRKFAVKYKAFDYTNYHFGWFAGVIYAKDWKAAIDCCHHLRGVKLQGEIK